LAKRHLLHDSQFPLRDATLGDAIRQLKLQTLTLVQQKHVLLESVLVLLAFSVPFLNPMLSHAQGGHFVASAQARLQAAARGFAVGRTVHWRRACGDAHEPCLHVVCGGQHRGGPCAEPVCRETKVAVLCVAPVR
jgi:hypothetical protein